MANDISIARVFARAQHWVDRRVTYSQQRNAPDPEGRPYRTDCSGLCCMAYELDKIHGVDRTTYNFRSVPGIISLGSLDELLPGDAVLKNEHMELFVRWKNDANHREGAYVYSFNTSGETVRNPTQLSNKGNRGFNDWNEMLTFRPIRYTKITERGIAVPAPDLHPVLRRGAMGDAVRRLQEQLNQHGYGLDVDGDFGPLTERAVRSFQSGQGIAVDGVVGAETWGRLSGGSGGGQPAPSTPAPTPPHRTGPRCSVAAKAALSNNCRAASTPSVTRSTSMATSGP